MRRQAEPAGADPPVPIVTTPRLAPTEATRRWAALLRQIFEVDPLACPRCAGAMLEPTTHAEMAGIPREPSRWARDRRRDALAQRETATVRHKVG